VSQFEAHFVARRLRLAMFNPHAKFEVSMTATKIRKAAQNVKILLLGQPLGTYIGLTHRVYPVLDGKRIVNFLLAIIERFC